MNSAKNQAGDASVDAISLLTEDHQKVRQMLQQFEELKDDDEQLDLKLELVEQICYELTVHALVEEELFYPAMRAAIDDDDLMDEAEADHAGIKDLVSQLEGMEPDDEDLDATMTVLSEQLERHITLEEEEIFAKAKNAQLDIAALGQQMQDRREEIEADFNGAPAPSHPSGGETGRAQDLP
ncbi:hemerythrin-like domain-containing protein [Janthinobacterium sp. CG_23.3]|uniref:hemerythrin domain-containing protein n=1 Tax=unclassified Janthinobacterium TaxID=2610881 RepID=UPI00034A54AD|nr:MULTISPECIES: hemerythrin domain-containing protein [unclassified Janthinobacterium]MEC5163641.1 hemerythrin-like domain-containing protein [Janthinobacterium sp. CG_S6]